MRSRRRRGGGLTLEALDPDAGLLRVERQLLELRGRPVAFGPLKTKACARELPIPESVVEVVLAQVAGYGEGPEGAVFTTHRGGLLGPRAFRTIFNNAVQVAGLPARTVPHDLRHTFASSLLHHGCSVKELQERLGHGSAKVTLDTYAHLMPDSEDRTREAIAENLGRIVSLSCPPSVRAAA